MSATAVGVQEVVQAWGRILSGRRPNLSIEITKECPCNARVATPTAMSTSGAT